MKDFNFFSPYVEVKKDTRIKLMNIVIIASASVILLSSFFAVNQVRISRLQKETKKLQVYLASPDTIKKLKEYEDTKQKVQALNEYSGIVRHINDQIDSEDKINTELMRQVSDSMPQGTFIKSLAISTTDVQLQGVAESRTAVAELEHNLKSVKAFTEVNVGTITEDQSSANNNAAAGTGTAAVQTGPANYTFTLNCKLGDVKK